MIGVQVHPLLPSVLALADRLMEGEVHEPSPPRDDAPPRLSIGIATHDDVLIDGAREIIARRGLQRHQYEFQMLLGVREQKRREIIAQGHRLRVYVPFGKDWYGYSIRRLKENPSVAGHVFKAIFTGD